MEDCGSANTVLPPSIPTAAQAYDSFCLANAGGFDNEVRLTRDNIISNVARGTYDLTDGSSGIVQMLHDKGYTLEYVAALYNGKGGYRVFWDRMPAPGAVAATVPAHSPPPRHRNKKQNTNTGTA